MKILYIDSELDGHHQAYLSELVCSSDWDAFMALPEKVKNLERYPIYTFSQIDLKRKKVLPFLRWMMELLSIANKVQPDIIHFLTGDYFYKFFGLGLKLFSKFKTVITLHWVRPGVIKRLSIKVFCSKVSKVVVHSEFLISEMKKLGVKNAVRIEYPNFKYISDIKKDRGLEYWGLKRDIPVILALGNTREDKGLDILISALNGVTHPFQLLVAGKPETFDKEYIDEHTKKYADCVKTVLRYLTDEEVKLAIAACDIVVLPYRESFSGASGPLGEGICCNKCIIGSDHGNLGYTILKNHLGYTFETGNSDALANVLSQALTVTFVPDDEYKSYREILDPKLFVKNYGNLYKELMME